MITYSRHKNMHVSLQLGYQNNCFPEKLSWILNEHFFHGLKCKTLSNPKDWIPRKHCSCLFACLPAFHLSDSIPASLPPSLPHPCVCACLGVQCKGLSFSAHVEVTFTAEHGTYTN